MVVNYFENYFILTIFDIEFPQDQPTIVGELWALPLCNKFIPFGFFLD